MKTLIVYYSRTKVTKKVAELLAKLLKGDIEEIIDLKNRDGALGYIKAGRDATLKKLTEIAKPKKDPSKYDIVLIGTPVWAFTMSTAIRTYITQYKDKFKKVAFFCTQGGSGAEKTFEHMEELCGKKPKATLVLLTKQVANNEFEEQTKDFAKRVK